MEFLFAQSPSQSISNAFFVIFSIYVRRSGKISTPTAQQQYARNQHYSYLEPAVCKRKIRHKKKLAVFRTAMSAARHRIPNNCYEEA